MSASDESSSGTWSKVVFLVLEKVLLAGITAGAIFLLQNRLQLSQERLEKAKHISEILVDKPVSIVAELPAHLDAFILYAEHIRSGDEHVSSGRLTDLQATISSDIEGSRAYYGSDKQLKTWAIQIKEAITAVRAKALSKKILGEEDFNKLEATHDLAYNFHRRIIFLSVQQAKEPFDSAGAEAMK